MIQQIQSEKSLSDEAKWLILSELRARICGPAKAESSAAQTVTVSPITIMPQELHRSDDWGKGSFRYFRAEAKKNDAKSRLLQSKKK